MVALGQTITVINRSGKVVSNSKSLIGVFKEAKSAYLERKAEIKASRAADADQKRTRRQLEAFTIDDDRSHTSSRRRHDPSRKKSRKLKPAVARGYTDGYLPPDRRATVADESASSDPGDGDGRRSMVRRHTEAPLRSSSAQGRSHGRSHVRSNSLPYVDMNLAYGDLPSAVPMTTEVELRGQMSKLTHLLDEANCLQHSVTTMIETLQRDPERLAAVGLALAEISTLVRGMAPGVLMAMKGSFPAAAALLASPQFLIAAGVGVGVTIVALGGYKIIKRIKARHDAGDDLNQPRVEELREIGGDLSRIEIWRRGIAEFEVGSAGTSVDGEFITPDAGRQMTEAGVLDPRQVRPATSVFEDSSRRKKDRKKERTSAAKASGKHSSPLARTKSERSHSKGGEDSLITRKRKELSGLKMLFSK